MAAYGRAVGCFQMVELWLSAIGIVSGIDSVSSRDEFLSLVLARETDTMGRLRNHLRAFAGEDSSLADQVDATLKRRNFLVHHFFRDADTGVRLRTGDGRREVLAELRADTNAAIALAEDLRNAVIAWMGRQVQGVDREHLLTRVVAAINSPPTDLLEERVAAVVSTMPPQEIAAYVDVLVGPENLG